MTAFLAALVAAGFVGPWHIPQIAWLRARWSNRHDVAICVFLIAINAGPAIYQLATGDWGRVVTSGTCAASVSYDLYRAWREHKPPRRKLRDRASELGRKLAERMQPVRVPVLVGAR